MKLNESDRWGELVWLGKYNFHLDNLLLAVSNTYQGETIACVLDRTPAEFVFCKTQNNGYQTFVNLLARLRLSGLYDGPAASEVFTKQGQACERYANIPLRQLAQTQDQEE